MRRPFAGDPKQRRIAEAMRAGRPAASQMANESCGTPLLPDREIVGGMWKRVNGPGSASG